MTSNIILIVISLFLIVGLYILRKFYGSKATVENEHDHETADGVCCGKHTNCEKGYDNSNLYFDDEELDRFKGVSQETYTDSDIEEFRQVLYTMKEEEVDDWVHCLQTRGIEIPTAIKDEILMMLQ